jgi:hypothetical protein
MAGGELERMEIVTPGFARTSALMALGSSMGRRQRNSVRNCRSFGPLSARFRDSVRSASFNQEGYCLRDAIYYWGYPFTWALCDA